MATPGRPRQRDEDDEEERLTPFGAGGLGRPPGATGGGTVRALAARSRQPSGFDRLAGPSPELESILAQLFQPEPMAPAPAAPRFDPGVPSADPGTGAPWQRNPLPPGFNTWADFARSGPRLPALQGRRVGGIFDEATGQVTPETLEPPEEWQIQQREGEQAAQDAYAARVAAGTPDDVMLTGGVLRSMGIPATGSRAASVPFDMFARGPAGIMESVAQQPHVTNKPKPGFLQELLGPIGAAIVSALLGAVPGIGPIFGMAQGIDALRKGGSILSPILSGLSGLLPVAGGIAGAAGGAAGLPAGAAIPTGAEGAFNLAGTGPGVFQPSFNLGGTGLTSSLPSISAPAFGTSAVSGAAPGAFSLGGSAGTVPSFAGSLGGFGTPSAPPGGVLSPSLTAGIGGAAPALGGTGTQPGAFERAVSRTLDPSNIENIGGKALDLVGEVGGMFNRRGGPAGAGPPQFAGGFPSEFEGAAPGPASLAEPPSIGAAPTTARAQTGAGRVAGAGGPTAPTESFDPANPLAGQPELGAMPERPEDLEMRRRAQGFSRIAAGGAIPSFGQMV